MVKHTLKAVVAGLILASSSAVLAGNPPPTIKADAPNRYTVKKGDTLWDIAGKYLDAPYRWREIWATNKQIKNPHLIYPNDILILCIIKGKTLVGIDTGEGCAGVEKQMESTPKTVEITSTEHSITPIPLSAIRHWLDRVIVVTPKDYEGTPYVLASKTGSVITGMGDKIYVKGVPLLVGQRYGIYRKGEPYIDRQSGTMAGLEVTQVAAGVVSHVSASGISSIQLTENFGSEVREGDRVFVEVDAYVPPVFHPAPAEIKRGGLIIRVMGSIGSAAKNSVVAINLGAKDGIQAGHVLDVYKKGKLVRDIYDGNKAVRLPSELSGQLMVFKTFEQISYAYVLSTDLPLNVGDQLIPPRLD